MAMQGSRKPKMKRNFLGDLPSFLRMVQEKVALSRPRVPHTWGTVVREVVMVVRETPLRTPMMVINIEMRMMTILKRMARLMMRVTP